MNEDKYRQLLSDLRKQSGYSVDDKYDPVLEYLLIIHPNPRTLIQFWCIEKFKYERSFIQKRELTRNDAAQQWVDDGFAKRFAELFSEELAISELYSRIMQR